MVTFYFLVRDALLEMSGARNKPLLLVPAKSKGSIRKRAGRTEYQRAIAHMTESGQLEVAITGAQGSGILSSMSEANCMVVLEDDQNDVLPGDTVRIVLFEGMI